MSTYTPTDKDLQAARRVMANSHDDWLPHYLIGVVRGLVEEERPAEETVRRVRAALIAYDERRG